MRRRSEFEQLEEKMLAPFAIKSSESGGRFHDESEHPYRTAFQRDRDRIIHSRAFRRLEYKTQVFVNHEGDHYRTRLTHTLEVSQIARTIARALALNEDLAEAISLAHDLGHTPFGHSGQDAMEKLMQDFGGFEHNKQSFRIVTFLERSSTTGLPGLNLTYEVLEGIAKHASEYDMPDGDIFIREGYPSIESQIANFADEIAYNNHDIDDGLRSGLLNSEDLNEVEIWRQQIHEVKNNFGHLPPRETNNLAVRGIINFLTTDLVENTAKEIAERNLCSVEDVRERGKGVVSFSEEVKKYNSELKKFLFQKLYRHYRVERMATKAERVISELFNAYIKNPRILPTDFVQRYNGKEVLHRIVCDYIAGMTDRFALEEYGRLFDPLKKV